MACNSGTCQSGGCSENEYTGDENGRARRPAPENGSDSNCRGPCIKCKVNEAIATTHHAVTGGVGGDSGRFCVDCFRSNLYGKFRLAVTSNAMISPSDNVLVAVCSSCQYQILPNDTLSLEYFFSMLPKSMATMAKDSGDNTRSPRDQIQDCLLSDSDDET